MNAKKAKEKIKRIFGWILIVLVIIGVIYWAIATGSFISLVLALIIASIITLLMLLIFWLFDLFDLIQIRLVHSFHICTKFVDKCKIVDKFVEIVEKQGGAIMSKKVNESIFVFLAKMLSRYKHRYPKNSGKVNVVVS